MMVFVKPKHVGAFIVIFNVNFNILKQFKRALVGQIKDLTGTSFFISLHIVSIIVGKYMKLQ